MGRITSRNGLLLCAACHQQQVCPSLQLLLQECFEGSSTPICCNLPRLCDCVADRARQLTVQIPPVVCVWVCM